MKYFLKEKKGQRSELFSNNIYMTDNNFCSITLYVL